MFSRFLAECRPERQHDPAVLDRPLLEAYLPWLRRQTNSRPGPGKGKPLAASTIITTLSPLSVFLSTWQRYQWQPPLPDQARIHPEDFPHQRAGSPRVKRPRCLTRQRSSLMAGRAQSGPDYRSHRSK